MIGLPTETFEDLDRIAALASAVVGEFYRTPGRNRARPPAVTVSVACFVPKPFTPFQWEGQDDEAILREKQAYLKTKITDRKVKYNYHDARVSRLEAVFARGDRRLAAAIELACAEGIKFDAWDECFDYGKWLGVFERCGIDPAFYANRSFGEDKILPWDMIDCGVDRDFLLRERAKAFAGETTPSCREACSACGADKLCGGSCGR